MIIVNPPDAAAMWFQIHITACEGFPDKALAPLPLDLAAVASSSKPFEESAQSRMTLKE